MYLVSPSLFQSRRYGCLFSCKQPSPGRRSVKMGCLQELGLGRAEKGKQPCSWAEGSWGSGTEEMALNFSWGPGDASVSLTVKNVFISLSWGTGCTSFPPGALQLELKMQIATTGRCCILKRGRLRCCGHSGAREKLHCLGMREVL